MGEAEHKVGVRELRLETRAVLGRVRSGESVEITAHGRPVARLVPLTDPDQPAVLDQLERAGQLTRAANPGRRPRMRSGDEENLLGETLADMRADRDL